MTMRVDAICGSCKGEMSVVTEVKHKTFEGDTRPTTYSIHRVEHECPKDRRAIADVIRVDGLNAWS